MILPGGARIGQRCSPVGPESSNVVARCCLDRTTSLPGAVALPLGCVCPPSNSVPRSFGVLLGHVCSFVVATPAFSAAGISTEQQRCPVLARPGC
eukprot:9491928-Pyramimonas_sp.AAC.1